MCEEMQQNEGNLGTVIYTLTQLSFDLRLRCTYWVKYDPQNQMAFAPKKKKIVSGLVTQGYNPGAWTVETDCESEATLGYIA